MVMLPTYKLYRLQRVNNATSLWPDTVSTAAALTTKKRRLLLVKVLFFTSSMNEWEVADLTRRVYSYLVAADDSVVAADSCCYAVTKENSISNIYYSPLTQAIVCLILIITTSQCFNVICADTVRSLRWYDMLAFYLPRHNFESFYYLS